MNENTIGTVAGAVVLAIGLFLAATNIHWSSDSAVGGVPGVNLTPSQGEINVIDPTEPEYTLSTFESGSIVLSSTTPATTTLPAARAGSWFQFIIDGAIATNNWIIDSAEGDNIEGSLIVAGAVVDCDAEDQINFVADGENVGDFVELVSDGTSWFITDSNALTSAKLTCTDPNDPS